MTIVETPSTTDFTSPGAGPDPAGRPSDGTDRGARPRTRPSLADTPTEHLEAELTGLVQRLHFGTYELLVLVGELDARGAWVTWGALSCAAWLAELCDIEVGTARTQVRVAHALRSWPALDAAMADGTISYAKARTLAAHLTDDNVEALLGLARSVPAGRLGAAIAAWSMKNEDQGVIDARHHEDRSLSWRTKPDGMVVFTLEAPPEIAGRIQAIIDLEVTRHNPEEVPVPSLAQQRHDALVEIFDAIGRMANGGGGDAGKRRSVAEVVVHVRPEGNALADGTPLSDHAVCRMLPDAFVSLLMEDNRRHPIDASPRRRFPTRRQRRVIDARDPECTQDGCHAQDFLQYDHIEPYDPQRPNTVIGNLQRRCGPHNRAKGNRTEAARGDR